MAESEEHKFLSDKTITLLEELSHTKLYGFKESERKKFDFTCELVRDWSRLVSGQTLWKHTEGIDKDLRTLLSDGDSKITLYIARDTIQNRRTVWEIVEDTKKTPLKERLSRLRVIWITPTFDADQEVDRDTVTNILKERLTNDIIIATVLGGISERDVERFFPLGGMIGINLAIAESIARQGFINMTNLAERLSLSPTTIRGRVHILAASGVLDKPNRGAQMYRVSTKGRVLLDLCRELANAVQAGNPLTLELIYLMELLGLEYVEGEVTEEWLMSRAENPFKPLSPEELFKRMAFQILHATENFGITWQKPFFNESAPASPAANYGWSLPKEIQAEEWSL
ncbi:DeoR family transcriptional regulator [Streptosporangium amethystogenes]|uniref:DeoR family transcriptional regulator n=1 Tax=Streptosporangium amethystogenes TaxID=2002 RepID=UPI0014705E59|nr:DeoR family transcriptional regulator [Streptosporangium amethystogenes]